MISHSISIEIDRPMAVVFDYLSTPSTWLEHLPTSYEIKPKLDRQLQKGEQVSELVKIAGLSGWVHWTCKENDGRAVFVFEGGSDSYGGSTSRISYLLDEDDKKTFFTRKVEVFQHTALMKIMEPLIRIYIKKEAKLIMPKVKEILEKESRPL